VAGEAIHEPLDLEEWKGVLPETSLGAKALLLPVTINGLASKPKVLLVASHLDADSSYRAELQLGQLRDKVIASTTGDVKAAFWGGDFNMTARNTGLEGRFQKLSGAMHVPTCYPYICSSRVDHLFSRTSPDAGFQVKRLATHVPRCPGGAKNLAFTREIQFLISTFSGERGKCVLAGTILLLIILLPVVLILLTPVFAVFCCGGKRALENQKWAVEEWGSDHLPLTVAVTLEQ